MSPRPPALGENIKNFKIFFFAVDQLDRRTMHTRVPYAREGWVCSTQDWEFQNYSNLVRDKTNIFPADFILFLCFSISLNNC